MTPDGSPKDDVKVPEGDIGTQISSGFDDGKELLVTIVSAMGEEQVSLVFTSAACALIHFRRLFRLRKPRKALSHLPRSSRRYFRLSLVQLHFTPFHLTSLRMTSCCACTFHGLIQRVYCIVLSFGVAKSRYMD